jgi:hypothetical protein
MSSTTFSDDSTYAFPNRFIPLHDFISITRRRDYFSQLITSTNDDTIACQELLFLDQSTQTIVNLERELQRQKEIAQTRLDHFCARKTTTPAYNDMRRQTRKFTTIKKPYSRSPQQRPDSSITTSLRPTRRPTTRSMTKKNNIDSGNQQSSRG